MTTMLFESKAEEVAYPIIYQFAKSLNLRLEIQHKIYDWNYKNWVQEKLDNGEWEQYDVDEYEMESGNSTTYSYQKYRLDFAFPDLKIGIEIDGEKYHDKVKDKVRDEYLDKRGWKIIRISAKQVFSGKLKEILDNTLKISYGGIK